MKNFDKIVSPTDKEHLLIIRESVKTFIYDCARKFDGNDKKLLDIAPQDYAGAKEFFKLTTVHTLDIDENSGADFVADLCNNNEKLISADYYDFLLCSEVLEHTLQPFNAVEEIHRILKKGGLAFITVPFNFRIHGPLPDCWRFTEHGLKALFKKFDIEMLEEISTPERDLMPIHYKLIARKIQ